MKLLLDEPLETPVPEGHQTAQLGRHTLANVLLFYILFFVKLKYVSFLFQVTAQEHPCGCPEDLFPFPFLSCLARA